MASNNLTTDNQLNYLKFATVTQREIPKALRKVFELLCRKIYGHFPHCFVEPSYGYKSTVRIADFFRDVVFRRGRKFPTDLPFKDWNTHTLITVICYINSFDIPEEQSGRSKYGTDVDGFHSCVVSENWFQTTGLAVDQLRLVINRFAHWGKSEMAKSSFDLYMGYVRGAFNALEVCSSGLDRILSLEFSSDGLRFLIYSGNTPGTTSIG